MTFLCESQIKNPDLTFSICCGRESLAIFSHPPGCNATGFMVASVNTSSLLFLFLIRTVVISPELMNMEIPMFFIGIL
jgi:hypothetical protein